MGESLFTPTSARKALESIRPAAELLCAVYRELQGRCPRPVRSDERVEPAYFFLVRQLHAFIGAIAAQGARVCDLKRGIIEFPARRGGRSVLLSWKVGEPSLAYWREPQAEAGGRRPIDDDGPWEEGHRGAKTLANPGELG
jgi:hypothetical protein